MRFLLGFLFLNLCIMPSRSKQQRTRAARSVARHHRDEIDAVALVAAMIETVLPETLAVQPAASQQQQHLQQETTAQTARRHEALKTFLA